MEPMATFIHSMLPNRKLRQILLYQKMKKTSTKEELQRPTNTWKKDAQSNDERKCKQRTAFLQIKLKIYENITQYS